MTNLSPRIGCRQHFPAKTTGRSPLLAAVDTATSLVHLTDFSSAPGLAGRAMIVG